MEVDLGYEWTDASQKFDGSKYEMYLSVLLARHQHHRQHHRWVSIE
jgi:hypothetical protein